MNREPGALELASAELMGTHRLRLQGTPNDNADFILNTDQQDTDVDKHETNHRDD